MQQRSGLRLGAEAPCDQGAPPAGLAPSCAPGQAYGPVSAQGWLLCFNRDESRQRPEALPPSLQRGPTGVEFLAPLDPGEGGTWILVNHWGLALALLNNYQAVLGPSGNPISRGRLVLDLAESSSSDQVARQLAAQDLSCYRGFHLLVLGPTGSAEVFDWDGQRLEREPQGERRLPLISSGYDLPGVQLARRAAFEREFPHGTSLDAAGLRRFQAARAEPVPGRSPSGAYGVRMSRPDARTVSQTEIEIGPQEVCLRYRAVPADPEQPLPPWSAELTLARQPMPQ